MGSCFSKKKDSSIAAANRSFPSSSSSSPPPVKPPDPRNSNDETPETETDKKTKHETVPKQEKEERQDGNYERGGVKTKKEVFVIKHRKSHDRSGKSTDPETSLSPPPSSSSTIPTEEKEKLIIDRKICNNTGGAAVRTSSCTKEEVDAILIQCGRLSRSNSANTKTRRYSGSKRSFDFDQSEKCGDADANAGVDAEEAGENQRLHRQRHRQSGPSSSPRERRRRTPSREREESKQRSGSRERGSGSRRVSRSPGRRSETPTPNSTSGGSGSNVNSGNNRPGKMVSVPATDKTSLANNNSNSNNNNAEGIKRITVKRNVASPRSQSPARGNSSQQQQQPTLSRSSSRKAEHSPYRRNPLSEIDPNSLAYPQSSGNKAAGGNENGNNNGKKIASRENEGPGIVKEAVDFRSQKPNAGISNNRMTPQATTNSKAASSNFTGKEQQEVPEESKMTVCGTECLKPQAITRSRSARRSRDLDINPEVLLANNSTSSYTALLLEDIQNFHQKTTNVPGSFSLPACVTKACSILEAVADLNSTTSPSPLPEQYQRNDYNFSSCPKKGLTVKDDLMEPSFEKYVTITRGSSLEDMEEQESSGSNSFTGSSGLQQHQWGISSSSWEPNSADSTDRWSSRSNATTTKERDQSPLGFESHHDVNTKKREFDPLKQNGISRGRGGGAAAKGLQTTTQVVAAAASM